MQERGDFFESEKTRQEKEKFLRGSNDISEFVAAYFEKGASEEFVRSSTILAMVKMYCENENIDVRRFHIKRIAKELRKRLGIKESEFKKINGKSHRGYFGVKIKEDIDLEITEEY